MERELLQKTVKESFNRKEVLEKLGMSTRGGSYITLNKYLKKYEIDISHFKTVRESNQKKRDLKEILQENTSYGSNKLKKRLFKEGLLENKCSICGQEPFWNGKSLVHILDHINGNHDDNRLENLRIVCRHCDSQLDTFGAKNMKNKREYSYCKCGQKLSYKNKSGRCIRCINTRLYNYCLDCECEISLKSQRCFVCANTLNAYKQKRKVERPSYEQLLKDLKDTNYCAVGRKYGVTDNAIRKWVKFYENKIIYQKNKVVPSISELKEL
jgi:hypothetical protein